MPPASRGILLRLHPFRPQIRPCPRRNISIQKPRDPRNFPTQAQARARVRAEKDEVIPEDVQDPALQSKEFKLVERIITRWRYLRNKYTPSTPPWLEKRPFLRTAIYSFFITVPITGFILMHFPLEPRRVTGPSMNPTINPECNSDEDVNYSPTWVLVQLYNPNLSREKRRGFKEGFIGTYNRGDLVLFNTPHDPEKTAVKRVVGVPGDTVQPMKGYDGGLDPVTVQYYQMWVEGDVNDRKKSIDSNYFGPISEALVRGKIIAMWSPWWNIFGARRPNRTTDDWPAKRQKRVAEGAVYEASVNPDKLSYISLFKAERGDAFLRKLRQTPDYMRELFEKDDNFKRTVKYYRDRGLKVAEDHEDPEIRDRASTILYELEQTFGAEVLEDLKNKKLLKRGERWRPQEESADDLEMQPAPKYSEAITHENKHATEREARERPAKAAMKEMIKQTRQMAELKEKEMEERKSREI